jgi:hypothetical protein
VTCSILLALTLLPGIVSAGYAKPVGSVDVPAMVRDADLVVIGKVMNHEASPFETNVPVGADKPAGPAGRFLASKLGAEPKYCVIVTNESKATARRRCVLGISTLRPVCLWIPGRV